MDFCFVSFFFSPMIYRWGGGDRWFSLVLVMRFSFAKKTSIKWLNVWWVLCGCLNIVSFFCLSFFPSFCLFVFQANLFASVFLFLIYCPCSLFNTRLYHPSLSIECRIGVTLAIIRGFMFGTEYPVTRWKIIFTNGVNQWARGGRLAFECGISIYRIN